MQQAQTYPGWHAHALQHDKISGADQWKSSADCELFDAGYIAARTERLNRDRAEGRAEELLFALDEGLHGNIGGIGRPSLYSQSMVGTHNLVTAYLDAVQAAIDAVAEAPESEISLAGKHAFFDRAIQCYGQSALLLSGGGGLIYHHHGVVEELLAAGVLPKVLCGSSAGAWVCAQLATKTDRELKNHFAGKRYHLDLKKDWGSLVRGAVGLGDTAKLEAERDALINEIAGSMTFQEAFEATGRCVNISVASADQHHRARLLNAVTSPHVTLRSAARASSCLPGFSKPVVLEAKDGRGNIRPYLPSQGWIDGAISSDLPMRPLARLYQVNHFIVSQINPVSVIAPYLVSDRKSDQSGTLASASKVYFSAMREAANRANQMVWPIRNRMTEGVAARFDRMELQNYSGDVTISHKFTSQSLRYLRFDFRDDAEIEHLAMAARRATWTRIDQIRNAMAIAQKLERVKQHLAPV